MKADKPRVVCFGEVLWDNLPAGRQAGGAPMNVAYHLQKLGVESEIISRIGEDDNGKDLVNVLKSLGLQPNYCQLDHANRTSTVEVRIGPDNSAEYDIVFPAAWDFIEFWESFSSLLELCDAFVFGSLASRHNITRLTLNRLLDVANYKVFDVNLREPFYEENFISQLLGQTDLLKLNIHELNLITSWYNSSCENESQCIHFLLEKFNISEVILTKGSFGACYYSAATQYYCPAYEIKVKDTVGSGDSFLAGFLSKRLTGESVKESMDFASAVSALVTMQVGACPTYTLSDIRNIHYKMRSFGWKA